MSVNLINLLSDNLRIKIVPREGATIEIGEGNTNPTAFIDQTGSLNACLSKKDFKCTSMGFPYQYGDPIGLNYWETYRNGAPDQVFALTATTESESGIETITARWTWSEWDYSDLPLEKVFGKAVIMDSGNGPSHFQPRIGYITAHGEDTVVVNPENWVIITFIPTPDLKAGEVDYFADIMEPITGEDCKMIACGLYNFPQH